MNLLVLFALVGAAYGRGILDPVPALIQGESSFIVGGRDTTIEEHPHQCSLRSFGSHNCGCVLFNSRWVLTAAHCIPGPPTQYTVIHDTTDRLLGLSKTPTRVIAHPDFIRSGAVGFPNDMGIVEVSSDIVETPRSQFIDMPVEADGDFGEDDCVISGWGRLFGGGPLPTTLQVADTTVMATTPCQAQWGQVNGSIHICLGGTGNEGACNGDSGGPLTCDDRNGDSVVAGITSWGLAGCGTTRPSVYVRTSFFRQWVLDNVGLER